MLRSLASASLKPHRPLVRTSLWIRTSCPIRARPWRRNHSDLRSPDQMETRRALPVAFQCRYLFLAGVRRVVTGIGLHLQPFTKLLCHSVQAACQPESPALG